MRTLSMLYTASLRMLVRDRAALIGTVVFPLLFVVVFALFDLDLAGGGQLSVAGAGGADGVDYFDFVLPGLLAMGLMNFTMVGIAGSVARFRELRVLRRITATPLSPGRFVAAQVLARLTLAAAQVLVMLGVGVALGATVRGSAVLLVVLASLGNLTFLSLGFAVAGRARSVDAATSYAGLATAPLMFLSGMFFPMAALPEIVQRLAQVLPITPLIESMRAVALDGAGVTQITGDLAVLLLWVPVAFLAARLAFRFSDAT